MSRQPPAPPKPNREVGRATAWTSAHPSPGSLPILLFLLAAQFARADSLDTLDGKSFTGKISLEAQVFRVDQPGAPVVRVPLAEVRQVAFSRATPAPVSAPAVWQAASVGPVPVSGHFVESNGVFLVSTMGGASRVDEGHVLVWQNVGELAELSAFIPPPSSERRDAERYKSAGLEIRARLDHDGPCYRLFSEGGRIGITQWHTATGREQSKNWAIPSQGVWLRLQRCGQQVTAFTSEDGRFWQQVGNEMIPLPEQAPIGLLLAGAKKGAACTVPFSQVSLRHEGTPPVAPPQLRLRGGGMLAGRFLGTDGSVVRWAGIGREWSVSLVNVSQLLLQPGAEARLAQKGPERPGVLLANGDFVDGELVAGEPGRIAVSSVLFGLRSYSAEGGVVGVQVRAVESAWTEFEVQCLDGSRLLADQVELRAEGLAGRERGAGKFLLQLTEVKELRRLASAK